MKVRFLLCLMLISILTVANLSGAEPKGLFLFDFDEQGSVNNLGGAYGVFDANPEDKDSFCHVQIVKDTDLHKKGYYLKISYDVDSSQAVFNGLWTKLNGADLSPFRGISLNIRGDGEEGFNDFFKIEVKSKGVTIESVIEDITSKWQKIVIPFDEFEGPVNMIEWNNMYEMTLVFEDWKFRQKTGTYYIDDIMFIPKDGAQIDYKKYLNKDFNPLNRVVSFPKDKTKKIDLDQDNKKILKIIARDTWEYFKNIIDKNTGLIMDNITVGRNSVFSKARDYTNITNIGLQIISIVAACDLGFVKEEEAAKMIEKIMATIKALQTWEGLYYNYYTTRDGEISDPFISTVDNGWLASGLVVLRHSFKARFKEEASAILEKMNFKAVFDNELGQLHLGYHTDREELSEYHYGQIHSENRIASIIAMGKKDIPLTHWFKLYRTFPDEWDWQRQQPAGKKKKIMDVEFFGGYYTWAGERIVPSWGGSMFEALMPSIILNETLWARDSFGENDRKVVKLQIKYAEQMNYPYWGFSPCAVPDDMYGGYHEFGVPEIAAKGYETEGIVTPHAIILALNACDEKEVMDNLKKLIRDHPDIYGQYGLYDSFDMNRKKVTKKYLALDQGMILITLCNYLNDRSIQKRFEADEIFQNVKDVLNKEKFFE
ncbi:MAG: DUF3131 domain-containing protein [Spirochaetes bacterium]|nr:DUF3131 domain-containing protein [Spirochaetota bacterium]